MAARHAALALPSPETSSPLWFDSPAKHWLGALPVGNGRLGAMVFGGAETERLHLSESTLWSGAPVQDNVNAQAREHLAPIRQMLFAGQYVEANEATGKYLLGKPDNFGTALPMAYLQFATETVADSGSYHRSLSLDDGIARVSFASAGVRYTREVFASHPAQVVVVRLGCERAGWLACEVRFAEPHLPGEITVENGNTLVLRGHAWESLHSDGKTGVAFEGRVRVVAEGGHVSASGQSLRIQGANAATLLVAAGTSFRDADFSAANQRVLRDAAARPYRELRAEHIADHRSLYRRVTLDLGPDTKTAHLPMDKRRSLLATADSDPALCAFFFQYGRYLTMAGSREDSPLPLALQGVWNDGRAAAMGWADDYHLDINTEQNYWVCETGALPECHAPVFSLLQKLHTRGSETARDEYGAQGWVADVTTDAWAYTAPGWGLGWSMFVTGGVWLATDLWTHYQFTGDTAFLRETAWPVLRDAARFYLSYMVEHPQKGWLVTGPSMSPENAFLAPGTDKACSISMGPTCDRVLVASLFSACISICDTLRVEPELRAQIATAQGKLPPFQIGSHGQLQEWLEDFKEAYPNHRHTSHLIALYPEDQISPTRTPALAQAARVTLERRTSQPDWEDTEWSRANLVNYYARLLDGEAAHKQLLGLMAHAADDSLLTYSRGGVAGAEDNIFAIDGNTAGAAGVAEMLLQSQADELHLLPALPHAWSEGNVRGLRARGGVAVDMQWSAGTLQRAQLLSPRDGEHRVRYGAMLRNVTLQADKPLRLTAAFFSGDTRQG